MKQQLKNSLILFRKQNNNSRRNLLRHFQSTIVKLDRFQNNIVIFNIRAQKLNEHNQQFKAKGNKRKQTYRNRIPYNDLSKNTVLFECIDRVFLPSFRHGTRLNVVYV